MKLQLYFIHSEFCNPHLCLAGPGPAVGAALIPYLQFDKAGIILGVFYVGFSDVPSDYSYLKVFSTLTTQKQNS